MMKNNPYYALSPQYKIDQQKEQELKAQKRLPRCIMCKEPSDCSQRGVLKGWCKLCETSCYQCRSDKPVRYTGYLKGWCQDCLNLDLWIADWADACWNESCKAEEKQNMKVFLGDSKAIASSLKE